MTNLFPNLNVGIRGNQGIDHELIAESSILFYVFYHISDMIPVALPPRVAGDGLKDPSSYFV